MDSKDVLLVLLNSENFLSLSFLFDLLSSLIGLDLSLLDTESWEYLLLVRDIKSSVTGSLHGTEDTVSSGGADETNIKVSLEWTLVTIRNFSNLIVASIDLIVTLEHSVQSLELEKSASAKKSSCVGSGIVGETTLNTESLEP